MLPIPSRAPRPAQWPLDEIVAAIHADRGAVDPSHETISSVTTDSREVGADSLFVALRGETHDGHRFVAGALRSGAKFAVVERLLEEVPRDRQLLVGDSQRALGDLAAWVRRRRRPIVCAVTGSNGKTTTKDMLGAICEEAVAAGRFHGALKTEGNFNNLIGLPLTLLRLREEEVVVLEMGMNRPGEIARLTAVAAPTFGVVTNVGLAHLEGVGGTIEGVARAKGELFESMAPDGAIAVNVDDERVVGIAAPFRGRKLTFGSTGEVQGRAVSESAVEGVRFELGIGDRTAEVHLRMVGRHNVQNALAAAAVASLMDLPIEWIAAGLSKALPPPERLQVLRLANGVTLIDDAYNANPSSVEAALEALRRMPGRRVAVLGDMRELGSESRHAHQVVGERAAALGVEEIFLLGDYAVEVAGGARRAGMTGDRIHLGADHEDIARRVSSRWRSGDTLLVKGSHGMHLENVVRLLREYGDST